MTEHEEAERFIVELRGPEGYYRSLSAIGNRITIGRSSVNHVQIPDGSVSRQHTEIVREGDTWWVVDLGSQNGTRVNDERVEGRMQMELGDAIQIEGFVLRVRPADSVRSLTMFETRADAIRPLAPSAPPTTKAAMARGMRISQSTI